MTDNAGLTAGDGTLVVATDKIGGVDYQRVKFSLGPDGTANDAVAGAGAVGVGVQRITLASDDVLVTAHGGVGDSAVSNPASSGSLIALTKGVLTLLSGSLAVTGPLTNAQLGSAGLATQSTLASILSTLQAQAALATSLWTDNSSAYYVRRDVIDQDSGTFTVTWTDASGSSATPGAGLRPVANEESLHTETQNYNATAGGTGYSSGDILQRLVIIDSNPTPPTVQTAAWVNLTTGAIISAPSGGNIVKQSSDITISSSALPTGASTAANQSTGNTSLAAIDTKLGGNLAVTGPSAAALATAAKQDTMTAAIATVGTRSYGAAATRVAVAATSAQSGALTLPTGEVMVHASTRCFIAAGSSPTATNGDIPLEAGEKFHMRMTTGHKIAVIRDTADGYLNIIPVA